MNKLKQTIEEKKFAKGEATNEIAEWSSEVEHHLERADKSTREIQREIKSMDLLEQEELAAEKNKNGMKHERELWEQKVKFEKKRDKEKVARNKSMTTAAKLLMLAVWSSPYCHRSSSCECNLSSCHYTGQGDKMQGFTRHWRREFVHVCGALGSTVEASG